MLKHVEANKESKRMLAKWRDLLMLCLRNNCLYTSNDPWYFILRKNLVMYYTSQKTQSQV